MDPTEFDTWDKVVVSPRDQDLFQAPINKIISRVASSSLIKYGTADPPRVMLENPLRVYEFYRNFRIVGYVFLFFGIGVLFLFGIITFFRRYVAWNAVVERAEHLTSVSRSSNAAGVELQTLQRTGTFTKL